MEKRDWVIGVLTGFWGLLCLTAATVVVVDPYFHYHAPLEGMSYVMEEEQYMNGGIAKNFEYDAIITGSSITEYFLTSRVNELFGVDSVRLTFKGEGYKKVNDNLEAAIKGNDDLKLVIRAVDTTWFVMEKDYMGYDDYPEYLYDDHLWNDVEYVFNQDIFWKKVVPQIRRTILGVPAKDFDGYVPEEHRTGQFPYSRGGEVRNLIDAEGLEEYLCRLDENLDENLLGPIEENPDITFYLFFPPYSICWWDQISQMGSGELEKRIQVEEHMIRRILPYENVRLFSFFNNTDLICDLDNYEDSVHYTGEVCNKILEWMKKGEYELTWENHEEYIEEIRSFYCGFDYAAFFDGIVVSD